MKESVEAFQSLPSGLQFAILGTAGAGVLGVAYGMAPDYAWVILAALIVVGLMLLGYVLLLRLLKKRKARPMQQALASSASSRSGDVSDPAAIARLEDMRKQFLTGIEKFKAAGKDVYSTPWYIVVGEPGSGKTEAIRHSQIGFPRGLQDPQQGAGGTHNMNWWFTNKAVILDMAGRVFMDETTEWDAFLGMLRKFRPNCPINGMLLVIPADTLISDRAEDIASKAGRIAEQFDHIQRALGVRFPVFVTITKSDKIAGFREFFAHVDDPVAQAQVLGWSNPAGLDQPFDPEQITAHLESVRDRLVKRRLALLQEPGMPDLSEQERQQKIDALYDFPASLMNLAPRLQRYLETIFVAGEWSSKPLFLRGIYFTSSMEEGAALDEAVATFMGVAPESLSDDGAGLFRRERSVFLRDMFLKKVFQEQGLVTNATNTSKLKRTRRMVTLSSGIIGVVAMLGLTWFGANQLDNAIGQHRRFWQDTASAVTAATPPAIVTVAGGGYSYAGFNELRIDGEDMRLGELPVHARSNMQSEIRTPLIFRPVASLSSDLNAGRTDAMRAMFETVYLQPLLDATRRKLGSTPAPAWTPEATAALAEVLRIDAQAVDAHTGTRANPEIHLAPLFAFVLGGEAAPDGLAADIAALQETADWLYKDTSAGETWPRQALTSDASQREVLRGVEAFIEYWTLQADRLDTYRTAEQDLLRLAGETTIPTSLDRWKQAVATWRTRFAALDLQQLDEALSQLGDNRAVEAFATLTAAATPLSVKNALTAEDVPDGGGLGENLGRVRDWLGQGRQKLLASLGASGGSLAEAVQAVRQGFTARRELLAVGDAQLARAEQAVAGDADTLTSIAALPEALDRLAQDARQARDRLPVLRQAAPPGDASRQAADAAGYAISLAEAGRRYAALDRALALLPDTGEAVADRVAQLSGEQPDRLAPPRQPMIPGTAGLREGGGFDPQYSPAAARELFGAWLAVGNTVAATRGSDAPPLIEAAELRRRYDTMPLLAYARQYGQYWTRTVPESTRVRRFSTWAEFKQTLDQIQPLVVNSDLRTLMDQTSREAMDALRALPQDIASAARGEDAGASDGPTVNARLLREPLFNDLTDQSLARWKGLPSDAGAAAAEIRRVTGQKFREDYLGPYGKEVTYWDELLTAGLSLLADAGHTRANNAIERLLVTANRFPLVIDETVNPLSAAELVNVREQLQAVAAELQNQERMIDGRRGDLLIGQGGGTGVEPIDQLLERLVGGSVLAGDRATWFTKMVAVTDALLGPADAPAPLQVTLGPAMPFSQFNRRPAEIAGFNVQQRELPHRYFSVLQGRSRIGPSVMNTDSWSGELPSFEVPGVEPIRLAFFTDASGREQVAATPDLPAPWNVLLAVTWSDGAVRADEGKTWHVPVPVQSGAQVLPYWVTLKFSRALPPATQWIRKDEWPRW